MGIRPDIPANWKEGDWVTCEHWVRHPKLVPGKDYYVTAIGDIYTHVVGEEGYHDGWKHKCFRPMKPAPLDASAYEDILEGQRAYEELEGGK